MSKVFKGILVFTLGLIITYFGTALLSPVDTSGQIAIAISILYLTAIIFVCYKE